MTLLGNDGLPIHLMIGIDDEGYGPVPDHIAACFICWCGEMGCIKYLLNGVHERAF